MTRSVMLTATMLMLACSALVAQDTEATNPSGATIADLVAIAREEAPRWLAAKALKLPTPAPIGRRVLPSRSVVRDLTAALDKTHSADADAHLYVLYQLLQPAQGFAAADLRLMLERLTALEAKAVYKPMFRLNPGQLLTLQRAARQPNTEMDRQAKRIRQQKRKAERSLIKHNLLVRKLRATIARLRILADDEKADRQVLAAVEADLRAKRMTYLDGLAAIWVQVTQISPDRATVLYDRLKPFVKQTGDAEIALANPGALDAAAEGNSRFARQRRCVGADVAKVVNVLATAARKPAVVVPKANTQPRRGRRGRRGRSNRRQQP